MQVVDLQLVSVQPFLLVSETGGISTAYHRQDIPVTAWKSLWSIGNNRTLGRPPVANRVRASPRSLFCGADGVVQREAISIRSAGMVGGYAIVLPVPAFIAGATKEIIVLILFIVVVVTRAGAPLKVATINDTYCHEHYFRSFPEFRIVRVISFIIIIILSRWEDGCPVLFGVACEDEFAFICIQVWEGLVQGFTTKEGVILLLCDRQVHVVDLACSG